MKKPRIPGNPLRWGKASYVAGALMLAPLLSWSTPAFAFGLGALSFDGTVFQNAGNLTDSDTDNGATLKISDDNFLSCPNGWTAFHNAVGTDHCFLGSVKIIGWVTFSDTSSHERFLLELENTDSTDSAKLRVYTRSTCTSGTWTAEISGSRTVAAGVRELVTYDRGTNDCILVGVDVSSDAELDLLITEPARSH